MYDVCTNYSIKYGITHGMKLQHKALVLDEVLVQNKLTQLSQLVEAQQFGSLSYLLFITFK
jgi:hypothetical protein